MVSGNSKPAYSGVPFALLAAESVSAEAVLVRRLDASNCVYKLVRMHSQGRPALLAFLVPSSPQLAPLPNLAPLAELCVNASVFYVHTERDVSLYYKSHIINLGMRFCEVDFHQATQHSRYIQDCAHNRFYVVM